MTAATIVRYLVEGKTMEELTIRNLRSLFVLNGLAWTGDLYEGERLVAHVEEEGNGGCLRWDWSPSGDRVTGGATATRVRSLCETGPVADRLRAVEAELAKRYGGPPLPPTLESVVCLLADEAAERARASKRAARTRARTTGKSART